MGARTRVKQSSSALPLNMDGNPWGNGRRRGRRFAQRARKQIGIPVEMLDERLTSWEAERLLEEDFFGRKI